MGQLGGCLHRRCSVEWAVAPRGRSSASQPFRQSLDVRAAAGERQLPSIDAIVMRALGRDRKDTQHMRPAALGPALDHHQAGSNVFAMAGRIRIPPDEKLSAEAADLRRHAQQLQAALAHTHDASPVPKSNWPARQWQRMGRAVDRLSPRVRGLVLLNVLVLLCASNWVVLKESEEVFDPFTFAALRFTVASLAFAPWLRRAWADPALRRGGVELGFWSALGYMTQSVGLITSEASRASFLSTFTVIVVPILAGISGRGVRPLTWLSAFVALFGVGLLEQGGAPPEIGDAWNLLSAVAFGFQVFRTEHYSHLIKPKSVLPLTSIIITTIAATSYLSAVVTHQAEIRDLLANPISCGSCWLASLQHLPWSQVLFTGLLSTDLVMWIEIIALHDVSSVDAAIVYAAEPVLGACGAYLMLGERWGPAGWAGAGLIVASSLTTQILGGTDKSHSTAGKAD